MKNKVKACHLPADSGLPCRARGQEGGPLAVAPPPRPAGGRRPSSARLAWAVELQHLLEAARRRGSPRLLSSETGQEAQVPLVCHFRYFKNKMDYSEVQKYLFFLSGHEKGMPRM